MSCAHCVHAVTSALADLPGVTVTGVSIGSAEVSYDPARVTPEQIGAAVRDAGYEPLTQSA